MRLPSPPSESLVDMREISQNPLSSFPFSCAIEILSLSYKSFVLQ
jgi:hypothetical protein